MLKKVITLAITVMTLVSLVSCGNKEVPKENEAKTIAVSLYGDPVSDTWILEIGDKETFDNSEIVAIYVITESQYKTFYDMCESNNYVDAFKYLNEYKYAVITGEEWTLLHSFLLQGFYFFLFVVWKESLPVFGSKSTLISPRESTPLVY